MSRLGAYSHTRFRRGYLLRQVMLFFHRGRKGADFHVNALLLGLDLWPIRQQQNNRTRADVQEGRSTKAPSSKLILRPCRRLHSPSRRSGGELLQELDEMAGSHALRVLCRVNDLHDHQTL